MYASMLLLCEIVCYGLYNEKVIRLNNSQLNCTHILKLHVLFQAIALEAIFLKKIGQIKKYVKKSPLRLRTFINYRSAKLVSSL